jgi:hypothetical protein
MPNIAPNVVYKIGRTSLTGSRLVRIRWPAPHLGGELGPAFVQIHNVEGKRPVSW